MAARYQRPAGGGDRDDLAAAVFRARPALDIAGLLQPIEQAGEIVLREQDLPLERERAQSGVADPRELQQNVVPGERREAFGLELRFDRHEHGLLRQDEPRPGAKHGIRRSGFGHDSHSAYKCICIKLDKS